MGRVPLALLFFTLPNLPPSEQRWRLQQYEHQQAAFARPKYACTAGYSTSVKTFRIAKDRVNLLNILYACIELFTFGCRSRVTSKISPK